MCFLGVKSGLKILVRVKDLTFCNSAWTPTPHLVKDQTYYVFFFFPKSKQ